MICHINSIIASEIADQLDIINSSPAVENGLVEFVTEEIKVSSFVPRIPVSRDDNPFNDQTPVEILSRERLIFQKNFSSTETTLMNVVNPRLLVSHPAAAGVILTFRYMRWKAIEYRVVIQSNPFLNGYLALTCLPNDKRRHNNSLALIDYGWFSHDDCLIVDITSMPESRISVPWLSLNTWVDLEKWSNTGGFTVDSTISRLNGLKILYDNQVSATSSTVPKAFSVSVFARFVEPELSCPISPGATFVAHEAQMLPILGSAAAGIAGDILKKKFEKGVESMANSAADKAEEYVTGLFGGEEGVGQEFGVTDEPPSEPAVLAHSVDDGPGEQPQEIVPSVYGNMNYSCSRNVLGSGTMVFQKGKQNSLSEFLQKPSMVHKTLLVATSGSVVNIPIFNGSDVFAGVANSANCSRLRYLSQFFRFWRGSITYTIMFISSPMVTFRFKVGLDYQGGNLSAIDPGDTLQTIVTVRGTTVHQVTVPYLYTTPWQLLGAKSASSTDVYPTLTVTEFSPASRSGDLNPTCYILVYESANRDFVFSSQEDPMPYSQTPAFKQQFAKHEAQMDIRKFRSQDVTQFGHINPVKFSSDGVGTFEAMAKRWSPVVNHANPLLRPTYYDDFPYESDPLVSCQSTIAALCGIFYYNRGQYKLKVSFDADPDTVNQSGVGIMKMESLQPVSNDTVAGNPAPLRFNDGASAISFGLTQVIEVTIPYLCTTEWYPTGHGDGFICTGSFPVIMDPELWTEGATSVPLNFVAVSAGRDFCFSYNLPPPYFGARWYDCIPWVPPPAKSVANTPQNLRSRMSATTTKFSLV